MEELLSTPSFASVDLDGMIFLTCIIVKKFGRKFRHGFYFAILTIANVLDPN